MVIDKISFFPKLWHLLLIILDIDTKNVLTVILLLLYIMCIKGWDHVGYSSKYRGSELLICAKPF